MFVLAKISLNPPKAMNIQDLLEATPPLPPTPEAVLSTQYNHSLCSLYSTVDMCTVVSSLYIMTVSCHHCL